MRILFVTPYVPSTVRIRPYAFIRGLAKRGHDVTLACLVQPSWEDHYLDGVKQYCREVHPIYLDRFEPQRNVLASLLTGVPMSVAYCRSRRMMALVRQLAQSGHYDLIHTEFVRAVPFTADLSCCPKVYDAVDSLTLTYRRTFTAPYIPLSRRLVLLLDWLKMRRFEPLALRYFDRVLVSSPSDQEALGRGDGKEVTVVPNGVDLDAFAFHDGARDEARVAFLGKMSYHVNVASILWFYHQVFPLIRRHRPDVRLEIVGRDPVPKVTALAVDDAVEVTGTVADVRPYLTRATISICPMVTGAGIQNKMLEALAVGTPTVSTAIACQALAVEPDREVLVADTAEGFATGVLELLENGALRHQLAINGRRYVERRHDWAGISRHLEEVYDSLHG